MSYIKDGKRYSANQLRSLGSPADYGYEPLNIQPYPAYDKLTQGITDAGNVKRNDKWFIDWQVVDLPIEAVQRNLERAKTEAIENLFAICDSDLEQLVKAYPRRESDTWAVQLQEAQAYLADNSTPTPFINAALEDGETVTEYANLIVANNTAWSDYAGQIVKKRRTYQKRIAEAATADELRQVMSEIND